jgi:hypothetical protein
MGLMEYIRSEGAVLKQAPWSFAGLVVVSLIAGFGIAFTMRSQEVANLTSAMQAQSEQLNLLKLKLSEDQISAMRNVLQMKPGDVGIFTKSGVDAPVSQQVQNVFDKSGWKVTTAPLSPASSNNLVVQAPDADDATAIAKAFDSAGVSYVTKEAPGGGRTFTLEQLKASVPR